MITREDIERSGQPTIAEVLRNLPANSGGSFSESFSSSFAPGAAGISLRGLGAEDDPGAAQRPPPRRLRLRPDGQDSFVDLNSIPPSRGGAGRDPEGRRLGDLRLGRRRRRGEHHHAARTTDGVEIDASTAASSKARTSTASTSPVGWGDLAQRHVERLGVLDYYKHNELLLSDTEFGKTRDYRGQGGGRNSQQPDGRWHLAPAERQWRPEHQLPGDLGMS